MYFDTVAWDTVMPSFSSSPWIRGAIQSSLARLSRSMSSRNSILTTGRPLTGTMDLTFSNGSTEAMPVAWASIRLETETKERFVFLSERTEEVLLGIHFLRIFKKTLTLSVERGHVELS